MKPAGDTDDPGHLFRRCSHVDVVIRSVGRFGVKLLTLGGGFSEALALEREPVSVVYQAIENGIGEGRITDDLVPMFDRKLAGHHGRAAAVLILHDLQEVAPLLGGHRSESPIVEDQKLDARQAFKEPSMMAVAACQRERIEEPRQALIEDRAVVPTSLMAERAGNPTLTDAGRADDEQVLVPFDPFAGDELLEQRLVEAARRPGAVAELVGIEGGVVSGVINLESSGVEASDWRPRHDEPYHEA